jgi:hypothetical protein
VRYVRQNKKAKTAVPELNSVSRTNCTYNVGGIHFPMKYVPGTNFSFKKF